MLRGRGHLLHRPSRCFPTARSQLHRLQTRRELEKTKEPRRQCSLTSTLDFRNGSTLFKDKIIYVSLQKKRHSYFLSLFFNCSREEGRNLLFYLDLFLPSPKGLRFNPSQEHVSQSHWTPWNRNGIVATCATLANPKD